MISNISKVTFKDNLKDFLIAKLVSSQLHSTFVSHISLNSKNVLL